jgi:hypothetical protein
MREIGAAGGAAQIAGTVHLIEFSALRDKVADGSMVA